MSLKRSAALQPDTINQLRSQVELALAMLAGMQLEVFTCLKDGPRRVESLAAALGVDVEKLEPLVYALVAADLLRSENNEFSNTEEAQEFLVKDKRGYLGGLASNLAFRWRSTLNTAQSINTGIPQAKLNFTDEDPAALDRFIRGLLAQAVMNGRELAAIRDFSNARTVADVGGGAGGMALALTEVLPHLRATVVDLPNIIPIAQKVIAESGAAGRIDTAAADLLAGPLDGRYDVVVARSLFQVFSRQEAATVAKNVGHAVAPGGSIHAIGQMLDNSRLSPVSALGFNLLALNIFDAGGAYTEQEYVDWLSAAGFTDFEFGQLGAGMKVLSARKVDKA